MSTRELDWQPFKRMLVAGTDKASYSIISFISFGTPVFCLSILADEDYSFFAEYATLDEAKARAQEFEWPSEE